MGLRPNFTTLESDGTNVSVRGISDLDDPAELGDVLDIQVILVQGERIGRGAVGKIASDWVATVPVRDPDGVGADFTVDDAVAIGIETRRKHATTITWTQPMAIVDAGP